MSDLDLYTDLVTRKLISRDGGAVTLPVFVLGDRLRCALRTMEANENGDFRERDLRVRSLRASLGKVLEAPVDGTFALRVAGNVLEPVAAAGTAEELRAALGIRDSFAVAELISPAAGCWLLRLTGGDPIGVELEANGLRPTSFVRIRAFEQAGQWWHEVRLIQAPLAFSDGHERVLAQPPSVRRIRAGRAGSDVEPALNELQAITVPPDFRGTYFLRWNFRVSKLLGIEDGPDEIAAALNAMFEKGKRFEATNPEPDNAYIEFIGELAGAPQPLITVEVNTFAPGVLTFTLPLDRAELAAGLRAVPQIEVPFEVELEVVGDDQDPADPAVPGGILTLFQQPVKIAREQIWTELATVQHIDWLRPPQPRDYIPFTPDQIITGVQHYLAVFGDGIARSFSFPHNLATEAIHLTVRENKSGGKVIDGFDATIASANELLLEFPATDPPPAADSLALMISSAGPVSAFQAHTHTMAQILGLLDALSNVQSRLEVIEDLLPTPNLMGRRDATREPRDIEIPDMTDLFPGARLPANFDPKGAGEGKADNLPRPPGLLPAIHDASVVPITVPLPPPEPNVGNVFQNTTSTPLLVPGGLGRRGGYLEPQGYAGSDGRVWYRLSQATDTNSFFPSDFERELFLLHINDAMWTPGGSFTVEFDLELRLVLANTRAQMLLVIEVGSAPAQATPAPVADNLENITWQPAPLLSQRIILTGLKLKHHFGAILKRSLDNVITAERRLYTTWLPQAPKAFIFTRSRMRPARHRRPGCCHNRDARR